MNIIFWLLGVIQIIAHVTANKRSELILHSPEPGTIELVKPIKPWLLSRLHPPVHIVNGRVIPSNKSSSFHNSPITVNSNRIRCGRISSTNQQSSMILGGNTTEIDEFPWMVLLEYEFPNGTRIFGCAGSIISEKFILTAAHCFTFSDLFLVNIRLGEWNINTNPDCFDDKRLYCADEVVDVTPGNVISHHKFNRTGNMEHDIALIRMKNNLDFSYFIDKICLPSSGMRSPDGEKLMVSGWGHTLYDWWSPTKLKLFVDVANQQYCKYLFRKKGYIIRDNQICAGGVALEDACRGDSGGPLMKFDDGNPHWIIEGIVSYGYGCGRDGWPGVYTRVSSYINWINSYIENVN